MTLLVKIVFLALCLLLSKHCHSHALLGLDGLHASCKAEWRFRASCEDVANEIKNQIDLWKGDNCGTGEKCLYKFISLKDNILKAKHETPKQHYVDDLTFTFKEDNALCTVQGYSTSETWYAVLDYGTNYCNLHNLITGAGLDKLPSYSEQTSDSKCTQYSSANCEKY